MQIDRIEKRLKKISNLIELFKIDGKLSKIENDLLLDYVRKLYDELSDDSESADNPEQIHATPIRKEIPPIVEKEVPKPLTIETTQLIVEDPIMEAKEEVLKVVKPDVEEVTQPIKMPVEPPKVAVNLAAVESYAELFTIEEVSDISGRLSMSKIDDINKAVGINERMFTTRELFDGNTEIYNTTVSTLNKCSSFDEAKVYLSKEIVPKFGWDSDEKLKKAQNFIKIARRLFA